MYRVASSRFAGTTLCALVACSGGGGGTRKDAPDVDFDRNALLAHLANNILLPIQADIAAKAAALPPALTAYCDALDGGNAGAITTTRAAAETAWADAVTAWQRADELLVGPAAMDNGTLRGRIYAWPSVAPCDLDRDVASHWTDPSSYDINAKFSRQRSLSAIEYLLFQTGTSHNCATEPTGWGSITADLPRARCRLSHTLALDVAVAAEEIHAAWRPDGGDYAGELARAGQGSSLPGAHEAVNLVSNSFFYVDRMVKDMKLAESAGISLANACGTMNEPCVREVELQYADRASFAIRTNLVALREAMTGTRPAGSDLPATDGPGFDDFLVAVGHPELAESMVADLDAAIVKADALPDSFLGALASNYTAVVETHAAVKLFTNDLKSQFLTVLALDIPDDVASDND